MSFLSEKEFVCPYCASPNVVSLEAGEGSQYEIVTDCEVCCRPIVVSVRLTEDDCEIEAHGENE